MGKSKGGLGRDFYSLLDDNSFESKGPVTKLALKDIQAYCKQQVNTLWDEIKRFDNPQTYYVDLSQKLWDIQQELLRSSQR